MKFSILFVALLVIIPFAYSEISINNLGDAYNLGENIQPNLEITLANSFNGFQQAEIICDSYSVVYSVSQINIEPNVASFSVPLPLIAFSQMKGNCRIKISLQDLDKSIVEEKSSDEFEVSDSLKVEISHQELLLNPSDNFALIGSLYNIRDEPISGTLKIDFAGQAQNFVIRDSNFNINIKIPSDIPSGEQKVLLTFEDGKGNYKDDFLALNIIPKPTAISITLDDSIYLPYQEMKSSIELLDQANAPMEKEIDINIWKDNQQVFSTRTEAGTFKYMFDNSFEPGNYEIAASFESIIGKEAFSIAPLQKIDSKLENQKVIINNTGNVDYRNFTQITLSNKANSLQIKKWVSLKPKETEEIELSHEAPTGDYTLVLPTGQKLDNIHIDDKRSFFKKATLGLASITGDVVKTVEENNTTFAFIVIFLVIVVVIAVLQYMGYSVLGNMRDSAQSVYSRFKKR